MSHRLFVRDFNPLTDLSDIESLFSSVGTVRKAVFEERVSSGVQRKVALIEMSTDVEAQDCIERIHGLKSDGYTYTVTADKPHVPDPNYSYKRPTYKVRAKTKKKVAPLAGT